MKANTFIVGAAKSGTTALSEYLRSHNQVLVSQPKEPYYFADDFPGLRSETGFTDLNKYQGLFESANESTVVACDASVYYLFSLVAVKNIFKYNPNAKLIVMLRNPVDMVYSYHSQLLSVGFENIQDFEVAWDYQEQRRLGTRIPKRCPDTRLLMYGEISMYSVQMKRIYETFHKENVHIVMYDDFSKDTQSEYLKVLDFLNLDRNSLPAYDVINENKRVRFVAIRRIIGNIPKPIVNIVRSVKAIIGVKLSISSYVERINVIKETRKPLSLKFRQKILSNYLTDICNLELIIDKDLTHWKSILK